MIRALPTFRSGTRWGDLHSTELQAVSDGVKQSLDFVEAAKRRHLRGLPRFKHPTAAGEPGAIRQFIYTGRMGADHLVCTDPLAEEETQVLVAKPWLLRTTQWNGVGHERDGVRFAYTLEGANAYRERRATLLANTELWELQTIYTTYVEGDELICAGVETGLSVGEEPIVWLDSNDDARRWGVLSLWMPT